MNSLHYSLEGRVATVRIDDGKRNALSPQVLDAIYEALDRAEADRAAVILTGRESVFSAGFDLNVMKRGGMNAIRMLRSGYALTARVMAYPYPVVAACNGHSFAMGVFLMLSAMLRHRLDPAAYQRAVTLSEEFDPEAALNAGFFDELVAPDELKARAESHAAEYAKLDARAHKASKHRIRGALIRKIRISIPLDLLDAMIMGLRGARPR